MTKVLGISAFYHDSAAAMVVDGVVVAAAQEERFTRKKHTAEFPVQSISYCLEETGLAIDELDAIVFYDKPLLKFERLLQTYYSFAPKGLISFLKAIPVWLSEKMFLKKLIFDGLKEVGTYQKKHLKLLFPEHHLSHAASAFFPSPFEEAALLTIDGVGEWCTASIGMGTGKNIKILKELEFPHSVGLLYSAFTYYLGFKVNSGEYKLMGLAPYGNPAAEETQRFVQQIKQELVDIKEDGSIWLNQAYFNYATGLRMVHESKWLKLFGIEKRKEEADIKQAHCNLAFAIQQVTEDIVLRMATEAKRITGAKSLCMAGGVALNCVANGKLLKAGIFDNVYIQPAAGDSGGALGAALASSYMYFDVARTVNKQRDQLSGAYLGPEYSGKEIELMSRRVKGTYEKYQSFTELTETIAAHIGDGKVVGWFQGRMEFGPRALGNRSILGDPRHPEMQKKLNLKIKQREGFRPFAPSVLKEDTADFFDIETDSPYMLFTAPVQGSRRTALPSNYEELSLSDKLYCRRSDIQAVTHLDFSARLQTVDSYTNPRYAALIEAFKRHTGYGLLINTSFNVRGEPIVCTPHDAYSCFMSTEMDYLVIGNYVFDKHKQPETPHTNRWKTQFEKD